jgi:flagellar hook-length control protein FliK
MQIFGSGDEVGAVVNRPPTAFANNPLQDFPLNAPPTTPSSEQTATPNTPLPPTMMNAEELLRLLGEQAGRDGRNVSQTPERDVSQQIATFTSLSELTPENREQLANLLREIGFSPALTEAVNNGNLNQNTFIQTIYQELSPQSPLYNPAVDLGRLAELFENKDFRAIVKNDINNQWLLMPEEVARDKRVSEHFKQVLAQASRLLDALNATGRGDTPTAQATNNLSNNINFLNQLNQVFTYIQLPLKMNGENTHGELFVYTNKKNLAKNDGNVSALLHLDMEYLGPLDVYIAMQNKNVTTKFYLADDSIIDLIAKHIHILNERLDKRGYALSNEFIARPAEKKPVEELLADNRNISVIGSYTFDARA